MQCFSLHWVSPWVLDLRDSNLDWNQGRCRNDSVGDSSRSPRPMIGLQMTARMNPYLLRLSFSSRSQGEPRFMLFSGSGDKQVSQFRYTNAGSAALANRHVHERGGSAIPAQHSE